MTAWGPAGPPPASASRVGSTRRQTRCPGRPIPSDPHYDGRSPIHPGVTEEEGRPRRTQRDADRGKEPVAGSCGSPWKRCTGLGAELDPAFLWRGLFFNTSVRSR